MSKNEGMKYDSNKIRMDLLEYECIEDVARILTFGAQKYKERSWMNVPNGRDRYFAALMRHLVAWRKGEIIDPESKEPHLSHCACNIMFLQWLDKNPQNDSIT